MFGKSAPWTTYFRQVKAMFEDDPEIKFVEDENDQRTLLMYVDNSEKADAISQLLNCEVNYGGVTATIKIIPANKTETKADLFVKAFSGNPAFSRMVSTKDIFVNPIHYCVFAKKVVQFWDDNLGDINGNETTLYQTIAENIFDDTEGVLFCTEDK